MIDKHHRVAGVSAALLLLAAPAFAQSAVIVQQARPHHANYAADAQYRSQATGGTPSADRSLAPYHRPHHAE